MPKRYTTKQVEKVLKKLGFTKISQKGSHKKYRKVTHLGTLTAIVPESKHQIPVGTHKSILRQANITIQEFEAQLGKK